MIQIDMEMPKNCLECPFFTTDNAYLICGINALLLMSNADEARPDWCPLREVQNND